ncbi:MAG: hypothetical protein E6Q28_04065 [Afipia sp.]|nr:MAG: hypothetical protein E6Q28_04065 [Afipia sp.]
MTKHVKTLWFDPQYRASSPDLVQAVKDFAKQLSDFELSSGLRKRGRTDVARRKFITSVEALTCNLILLSLLDEDIALAVPRAHGIMWSGGRYANPVYGQHFLDGIAAMVRLGALTERRRGYRFSAKAKALSLVAPTKRLTKFLPSRDFNIDAIKRLDEPEVLILKSGKDGDGQSTFVDYRETHERKLMRGQIARINKRLLLTNIEITNRGRDVHLGNDGNLILHHRRTLRRIFNNGDWQQGGRLAGGFWMSMPRAERFERIRLDGEPIADVDYRQLFPRLAYVNAQADQPEGDIYDVVGDGTGRDGWKTLLNAMLFSKSRLKNWPEDTRDHFPDGTKLRDAIDMLKQRHAPIARFFGTGIGFRLMRIESDMLIRIVSYLLKSGITALPLHDAILVARHHAETAKKLMQDEFTLRTRSRCAIVSIDFGPN